MGSFDSFFKKRLEELVAGQKAPALLFFRGFLPAQIETLIGHPASLLPDPALIRDGGVDLTFLEGQKRALVQRLTSVDGVLVGFYEELIALCSVVSDPSALLGGPVIVVENDLFGDAVPSCMSDADTAILLRDTKSEKAGSGEKAADLLAQYYSDPMPLDESHVLVCPRNVHKDIGVEPIAFFPAAEPKSQPEPQGDDLRLDTKQDLLYRFRVMEGEGAPVHLLTGRQEGDVGLAASLRNALTALDIPFSQEDEDAEGDAAADIFIPKAVTELLKHHWGSNASFRDLHFYRAPATSKETVEISQGALVSEVIDQCERAEAEEEFRDIFITAPTGAGKSLLFQLPALYLAERCQAVTLVISPLIALMNDQVSQLEDEHGSALATYLNSTLTYEERQQRSEEIQSGKRSIVYLAPELLLSSGLDAILGDRRLGLLVIDEAHTVTSWGRDFRSDYWYLGDFLRQARRDRTPFPVMCLTATAVYTGPEDMVNDTIRELDLNAPIIHLGSVKREDISFDITRPELPEAGVTVESLKQKLVIDRLIEYVGKREKTLVYCPFRTQVEGLYVMLDAKMRRVVRRYHSRVTAQERKLIEKEYRDGTALGLICTKAFGMGVDVKDIKHVIHFAPTGTLSDYVQEIGRAARDPSAVGTAHMDYFKQDIRYVRTLNGLSEMKQKQLKSMLQKLVDIYDAKKHRNLLLAPDSFAYLFQESEAENKTKNGLLLLAKDLKNKYGFPVLVVRPRLMLTENFVNVPPELTDRFQKEFGEYAAPCGKVKDRFVPTGNSSRASEVYIRNVGEVYRVRMGDLWEARFPHLTFAAFKHQFFNERLDRKVDSHLSPRIRVTVHYHDPFDKVQEEVTRLLDDILAVFTRHKLGEKKTFDEKTFRAELNELRPDQELTDAQVTLLLAMMTQEVDERASFNAARSSMKVLQRRKQKGKAGGTEYRISSSHATLKDYMLRLLGQCEPDPETGSFSSFVPDPAKRPIMLLPILKLMEIMGLASYELQGGEAAELFVRINDPEKLRRLAGGKYSNGILTELHRKHEDSRKLLTAFFQAEMDDASRWALIEDYFLGNDEAVRAALPTAGGAESEIDEEPEEGTET
ncbi:DEAD/DEAH box helicase [Pseudoflavonifractor sp. MSJ-37]|uniref:DEAD/DEAH box helicase n=1 Tax=Pseudoflavonifractor sp. MSJ-37 TaxID=2841531 RepID=UPI001C0FFF1B|nr:DEAD/DEAH box helicase [Pseudoflavonifractor sp. MSJ-37]MBU5434753.1 DEAD/DEAH box helicase [Pseudoflavonifractor sp. MSJ-37]